LWQFVALRVKPVAEWSRFIGMYRGTGVLFPLFFFIFHFSIFISLCADQWVEKVE